MKNQSCSHTIGFALLALLGGIDAQAITITVGSRPKISETVHTVIVFKIEAEPSDYGRKLSITPPDDELTYCHRLQATESAPRVRELVQFGKVLTVRLRNSKTQYFGVPLWQLFGSEVEPAGHYQWRMQVNEDIETETAIKEAEIASFSGTFQLMETLGEQISTTQQFNLLPPEQAEVAWKVSELEWVAPLPAAPELGVSPVADVGDRAESSPVVAHLNKPNTEGNETVVTRLGVIVLLLLVLVSVWWFRRVRNL